MVWSSVIKHSSPAWLRLKSAVPCTKWNPAIQPLTNRQVKRIVVSESTWTKCCLVVPSCLFFFLQDVSENIRKYMELQKSWRGERWIFPVYQRSCWLLTVYLNCCFPPIPENSYLSILSISTTGSPEHWRTPWWSCQSTPLHTLWGWNADEQLTNCFLPKGSPKGRKNTPKKKSGFTPQHQRRSDL